jgi:DNA replication protein DnaC
MMANSTIVTHLLKQLHLNAMQSSWDELAQQAEENRWAYSRFLEMLCEREIACKQQRRIQKNILEAKLPIGKSLDTFDFTKAHSINTAQISAFADNTQWVGKAHNLMLFGPSGVGKTHIAAAIGRRLSEHGIRVLFTKTTALVARLHIAHNEHKLADLIAKLAKFQLLILDDIGYVKKSEAETSVLFELIADRYESGSLLITSNQAFDQWDTIFPNNIMAVAAIDRLIHHATIININEVSYRKASKTTDFAK